MVWLASGAAFFVVIHLLVSGTRMRDGLVARLGEGAYMGLFSAASVAGLAWLGWGYAHARHSEANVVWWGPEPLRHAALGVEFIAFLFIVPGLATPNPTSVKQEGVLDSPEPARGMVRITRHPFLWGVAIWAVGHLLVNGDLASLLLFGPLLVLAISGTLSIDAKRARAHPQTWPAFLAATSSLPFAAILQRRQRFSFREIGMARVGAALAAYALLVVAHPWLFGVNPLG